MSKHFRPSHVDRSTRVGRTFEAYYRALVADPVSPMAGAPVLSQKSLPLLMSPPRPEIPKLAHTLARDGFAFVQASAMLDALNATGRLTDWTAFAASWNDLPLDTYMADGGRYRRRRHAVYALAPNAAPELLPHQAHYQSVEYNPLNGGVARWFEPVASEVSDTETLRTILKFCADLFGRLSPSVPAWHIEMHQFRIEARPGENALPTPEGPHRDGVDHVLVLLVARHNIAQGTTTIHDFGGRELGSFTLTRPLDAALVDDARVYHGVTPVRPLDETLPSYRDVLVITFRKAEAVADKDR